MTCNCKCRHRLTRDLLNAIRCEKCRKTWVNWVHYEAESLGCIATWAKVVRNER